MLAICIMFLICSSGTLLMMLDRDILIDIINLREEPNPWYF